MTAELPRYYVISQNGGRAVALDRETGAKVVLRELVLGRVSNWKEVTLFERESRVLKQLDHPAIPKVLDSFRGGGRSPRYYLVTEFVDGTPLSELDGLDQASLLRVARDVLDALVYMQSFSPPVLHRNITADHILVDAAGRARLIGFGSVQVELSGTAGGSTMVGTNGYMAPEQLMGRATPASDVFGLGASLVCVLTGEDPSDLPVTRMRLQWLDRARFGTDRFLAWVDRMIAPELDVRFPDAEEALRGISSDSNTSLARRHGGVMVQRPVESRIALTRTAQRLDIELPAAKASTRDFAGLAVVMASIALFAVWSKPFVAAIAFFIGAEGAVDLFERTRNLFTGRAMTASFDAQRGYRIKGSRLRAGNLEEFEAVQTGFGGRTDAVFLSTGAENHRVGTHLSPREVEWLTAELRDFLKLNT